MFTEAAAPHCLQTKRLPTTDHGWFCGSVSKRTSTIRRSHLALEHWMLQVTWASAGLPGGYLPVHRACRCEAMRDDCAANEATKFCSGHWEWPAGVLIQVGVLKPLQEPNPPLWTTRSPGQSKIFFKPIITLGECETANFSKFETFDNYCVAMFSFEYLHSHYAHREGAVNLDIRSHRFLEAVVSLDDIFAIESRDHVRFDEARYQEKVITRWRGGLDDRRIRPKAGA